MTENGNTLVGLAMLGNEFVKTQKKFHDRYVEAVLDDMDQERKRAAAQTQIWLKRKATLHYCGNYAGDIWPRSRAHCNRQQNHKGKHRNGKLEWRAK